MRLAIALLVDLALLVGFAAIGRRTHAEGNALGQVLVVAMPFALGWLVAAALVRLDRRPLSVTRALRAWAIAAPLGLALRATAFSRGVAPGFIAVALAFTLAMLVGWRGAFGLASRRRRAGRAAPRQPGGDKRA